MIDRLRAQLAQPAPIAPLVAFRLFFGAALVWECWRYASKGWIKTLWIDPSFHFKYYGFSWVEPWPGDGLYVHVAVLALAALCLACGLAYRLAALTVFVAFSYLFLLDQATYLNHFYLVILLAGIAVVLSPHRALSLDLWRGAVSKSPTAPQWQLALLRFQIAVVYVFAGIAKCNGDWLNGQPMQLWMAARAERLGEAGAWLATEAGARAMSYGGLALDLLIVPALLWRRTRVLAFGAALLFHLANAWLFSIGIFPWLMIALTALFFPASSWARVFEGIARRVPPPVRTTAPPLRPLAATALAAYVVVQVAVPFRHGLYPGDVAWSEEGHRFAWRMKLRDKRGAIRFEARTPEGAVVAVLDPADYLNRHQVREIRARPDMVLQFAHLLRDEFEAAGYAGVAIHATSRLSLNGGPTGPLVHRDVDLAREPRSLAPAPWITARPISPAGDRGLAKRDRHARSAAIRRSALVPSERRASYGSASRAIIAVGDWTREIGPVENAQLLERIPLFRDLGEEALGTLAERAQRRSVRSKATVIQQGEEGSTVFAILSGRLKVQRASGAGTVVLDVLGPGQIFGELALLTGGVRTASVIALEPCELLSIDQRDLRFLLDGRSELAWTFLRSMASRVIGLSLAVEELHTMCLGPRLASRVCAIAREHGKRNNGALSVDLRLSQADWADLAGANREGVNRQFRAWEREGWIRVEGRRLVVVDFEALRSLGDIAGLVV